MDCQRYQVSICSRSAKDWAGFLDSKVMVARIDDWIFSHSPCLIYSSDCELGDCVLAPRKLQVLRKFDRECGELTAGLIVSMSWK